MRPTLVASVALVAGLVMIPAGVAAADQGGKEDSHSDVRTVAVYGDSPYGTTPTDTAQVQATPAFIGSINADPDVSLVLHVGDIHSGKQYCTEAYDRQVFDLWKSFADPLVYTPGDNEWTDCNKKAEGGGLYNAVTGQIDYVLDASNHPVDYASGDPVANLDLVRSIFFAKPGVSLGQKPIRVISQAKAYDRRFPTDAKFVENVMFERDDIVYVTANIPGGSNNDSDVWYAALKETKAQSDERNDRIDATKHWLDTAFRFAQEEHARGVVISAQADMWDPEKGAAHQAGYEPIVSALATDVAAFGRPVLMLNGDSHVYRSDNPLSPTAGCTWELATPCPSDAYIHPGYDVANFHRVVVHGSTTPLEWLKLTVDPEANGTGDNAFGPFSWVRQTQS
jgi:hypothetical protein